MTTPLLDILELVAAQTQPHIPINEAFRTLEVFGQLSVINIENTPPVATDGDSYIVGDVPTGVWVGYNQWIAYMVGGGWRFALPRDGWLAFNQTDELYYRYVGGASPTSWEPLNLVPAALGAQQVLGHEDASPTGPAVAITLGPSLTIDAGVMDVDIVSLAALATPDADADYVMVHDSSTAGGLRKVLLADLPPSGIPQNLQSGNYDIAASDNGRSIDHLSGAGAGDVYTILANSVLALPVGFTFSVCNLDTNAVSIAINTDTMYLIPGGATGTRTLAQYGLATFRKVASTTWVCSGPGLT
jgi:hypothetical protein